MIQKLLYNVSQSHAGKIFLILFLFLFFSLVSLFVFYNGYLVNFDLINRKLFGGKTFGFLDHVPYHSFSILLSSLGHPVFMLGLVIIYFPVIFYRRIVSNAKVVYSKQEKTLVFTSAFLLTWELVTYDYNYYLDSAFYFDRAALVILTISLLRFPLLTPLYIAFAFVYRSQFNYPVAGFELYDKRLLFDILLMFVSFRYIKTFIPGLHLSFVWLVLCIVASNYFYTGLAKIIMSPHGYEWITQNNLADLFLNVHLRGWMANTSYETVSAIWRFLDKFHIVLQLLVLIIELSSLFLLRNRMLSLGILVASFFMHLGIFFGGSMLFWKWMAIDVVLFYLIWKKSEVVEELKYKTLFGSSVLMIALAFIWLRPYMIGWFDTPANQFYTYEVEDRSGTTYQLTKNQMDPYHQWFQYDHFSFLTNGPCLPITGFGYTNNYTVFSELKKDLVISDGTLMDTYGEDHFNSRKTELFFRFIQEYFKNRNKRAGHKLWLTYLRAPYHLHSSAKGYLFTDKAQVSKFRMIYNLTFSSSGRSTQLKRGTVCEINIPE